MCTNRQDKRAGSADSMPSSQSYSKICKKLLTIKWISYRIATVRKTNFGVLAQLGEHLPYKQRVTGSSPVGPISFEKRYNGGVAQLARAHGSYPWCRGFKSPLRYFFISLILQGKWLNIRGFGIFSFPKQTVGFPI